MQPTPTPELREALRIQLNPNGFRQNAVIESVNIIRAQFLDDIVFEKVGSPEVIIPSDIDDFTLSNAYVQDLVNKGKTPEEILSIMKSGIPEPGGEGLNGITNPLQWQKSIDKAYQATYLKFLRAIKDLVAGKAKEALGTLGETPFEAAIEKEPPDVFKFQDVKQYCTIKDIQMGMEFNNQVSLGISLEKMREIHGPAANLAWMPQENDLVEISLRFADGQARRVFTGLIAGVSFNKAYGAITSVNVVAYGLAKFLTVNKMVTDRAVLTQFESGELAQIGLTPWSNYFSEQTVDSIFQFLMTNAMGMRRLRDNNADKNTLGDLEEDRNSLVDLDVRVDANLDLVQGTLKRTDDAGNVKDDSVLMANHLKTFKLEGNITPENAAKKYGKASDLVNIDFDEELERIRRDWVRGLDKPELQRPNMIRYGALFLLSTEIRARIAAIIEQMTQLRRDKENEKAERVKIISYDMKFDRRSFASAATFQMTYLPLMTMALWKIWRDDTVAKFRGRRAVAYEQSLRSAFNLFFSQLQTPATILNSLRSTAKYAVYENENGEIISEIPRYNEFLADDGERIEEFIISNPMGSMEVVRQDLDLITRLDSKQYITVLDYQPYTFSSRQYTDIAVLSKYGMRADAPIYNPNATGSLTASMYAALEVTAQNANTRTMVIENPADRKFKLGRLYFIAVGDLNDVGGGPDDIPNAPREIERTETERTETEETETRVKRTMAGRTRVDGYVGYLNGFNIVANYGEVISYRLSLNYVRKAKLLISATPPLISTTVANFKVLPDLGSLIDVMVKASELGTTDPKDQNQTGAPKPPKATLARLYGDKCYVTEKILSSESDSAFFAVAPFMIKEAPTFFQTAQKEFPSIDAPSYNLTRRDGLEVDSVPVTLKTSYSSTDGKGAALTSDLMWTLHLIDARLRTYNYALYRNNPRFGVPRPDIRASKFFQSLYIPSVAVNPWYYLNNPTGLNLQVIDPNSGQTTDIGQVTQTTIGRPDDLRVGFYGSPIDIDADYTFCIMSLNDVSIRNPGLVQRFSSVLFPVPTTVFSLMSNLGGPPSSKVTLSGLGSSFSGDMFRASEITKGNHPDVIENAINANAGLTPNQKTKLIEQAKLATKQLNEFVDVPTDKIFLPVIIKGPLNSDIVVDKTFAGYPFTLMDIADISPRLFTGNAAVSSDRRAMQEEHALGRAVDIVLASFYAKTGLALRDGVPHPLAPAALAPFKDNFMENLSFNIRGRTFVFGSQKAKHGDPFWNDKGGTLSLARNILREENSTNAVKDIFDATLTNKIVAGFPSSSTIVSRLRAEDKFWYHIRMNDQVELVSNNPRTTSSPTSRFGQTPFVDSSKEPIPSSTPSVIS
jgi:hypothetical protein